METVTTALTKVEQIQKSLENKLKRLEIVGKNQLNIADKLKYDQESEKRDLENESLQLGNDQKRKDRHNYLTPLQELIYVAQAIVIDDTKTVVGSEPAIKSLLNEEELKVVKKKIMKKIRKL
jgi:hypothetical protein